MSFEYTPLQKEWLAALKSGRFKQAKNYLRNGEGYCCLGVACELLIEKGLMTYDEAYIFEGEYSREEMPGDSWKLFGLRSRIGAGPSGSLAQTNDQSDNFDSVIFSMEMNPELYFENTQVPLADGTTHV